MPGREHSDWYPPALILGTALATFLLGSATAMWLFTKPLPAVVVPTALAQGGAAAPGGPQMVLQPGLPPGPGEQSTAQGAAAGASRPAETVGLSSSSAAPAAAASSSPETAAASSAPAAPTAEASTSPSAAPAVSADGSASPAAPQAGNFSLQFGAFLDQAKSKSAAAQIAARGYAPVSVDAADGYGRTWHFVRLGAFADEHAAALAASDLLAQAGIGAAIVRIAAANGGG
jgi:cell division septation protein DedD